jgi:nucleoside-diphosphate-sugar epimerase
MNRISILGCGWLGMPLGKKLVELGFSVNGSTTRESKLNHIEDCGMTPFQIDLKNQTDGFDAFFKTEILIITLPPSNSVDPHAYFDQLELIKKNAQTSKVKHILFISSSSVYLNSNVEVDESVCWKRRRFLNQMTIPSYDSAVWLGMIAIRADGLRERKM